MEEMVCSTKESSAATLKRLHDSRGGAKARATGSVCKTRAHAIDAYARADQMAPSRPHGEN